MFCSVTTKLTEKYNSIRHKQTCYNSIHSYLGNIHKSDLLGSSSSHKSRLKYYIVINDAMAVHNLDVWCGINRAKQLGL